MTSYTSSPSSVDLNQTTNITSFVLEVGQDLDDFVNPSKDQKRFVGELLPLFRKGMSLNLGVEIPGVTVRLCKEIEPNEVVVKIGERTVCQTKVPAGCLLIAAEVQDLHKMGLSYQNTIHPFTGQNAFWILQKQWDKVLTRAKTQKICQKLISYQRWDIPEYLILLLCATARKNICKFVNLGTIYEMMNVYKKSHPGLMEDLVPVKISSVQFLDFIHGLLQNGVSILDRFAIFEYLVRHASASTDMNKLSSDYAAMQTAQQQQQNILSITTENWHYGESVVQCSIAENSNIVISLK